MVWWILASFSSFSRCPTDALYPPHTVLFWSCHVFVPRGSDPTHDVARMSVGRKNIYLFQTGRNNWNKGLNGKHAPWLECQTFTQPILILKMNSDQAWWDQPLPMEVYTWGIFILIWHLFRLFVKYQGPCKHGFYVIILIAQSFIQRGSQRLHKLCTHLRIVTACQANVTWPRDSNTWL